MSFVITAQTVLEAYRLGYFPMAESSSSEKIYLINPDTRGQLPISRLHIPRSLLKQIRKGDYDIRIDTDFEAVISYCAEQAENRPDTWLNPPILSLYIELHHMGHAHSVEYWQGGRLVGGLYGLAIGSAFFGESMFSREKGASKIALVHLAARLWHGGFTMLDTQWSNRHLEQFGCYEITHEEYMQRLKESLSKKADFLLAGKEEWEILKQYLKLRDQPKLESWPL